ncbi:MAG: DUF1570 domain-containing protein [Pirellulales bacterium]|nr:DUF1570 domain-containing protein [Pirellulales bacterium]
MTILARIAATVLVVAPAVCAAAEPPAFMMRAVVAGRLVEGQPIAWSTERVMLLGRDGALYDFAAAEAKQAKRIAGAFQGYSSSQMQALLREEFGAGWEVTPTAHFVVAHPRGPWSAWAERLESLYRNFVRYMSVRQTQLAVPATPLAAVVFRNEQEYYRYAAAGGANLAPGTLGHYDPASNRIYLFDVGGGGADWSLNASTIIHEAAHQSAYNTGVHSRFAEQSRWVVEGLAMLFEAPGVWNPGPVTERATRINGDRLRHFRRTANSRREGWIAGLVASDERFTADPLTAYAEAWTLTYYLSETRPQQYGAYLAQAARRPLLGKYPATDRARDFAKHFGADLPLLAAQVQQFVDELP